MRVFFIPDGPELLLGLGVLLAVIVVIAVYRTIRPPLAETAGKDERYRQALAVYASRLVQEVPTRDERRAAVAAAVAYLRDEHGVAADAAEKGVRALVAESDKALSYDLRHDALAYEQAGAYDLALDHFERAARLQEEHDAKDYQFLQRCIARVRPKARGR